MRLWIRQNGMSRGAFVLLVAVLYGCAPAQLRSDYAGLESAYAASANKQMLLNLARLEEHHPVYFFKLGQINSGHSLEGSVGGGFNVTSNSDGTSATVRSAAPALKYTDNPQFVFIPVNDNELTQRLLRPIPAEFVYLLYQQGWPVDQLIRLLVDRIEVRDAESGKVEVFRNSATRENAKDFATFLRICAVVRALQDRGELFLEAHESFVPLAQAWLSPSQPALADLWKADESNASWRRVDGDHWAVGKMAITPTFRATVPGDVAAALAVSMPELAGSSAMASTLAILGGGFVVQERAHEGDQQHSSSRLILRSLMSLMAAAAQEQGAFDELMETPSFSRLVPAFERRPLLRLSWPAGARTTPALTSLSYAGKNFMVADEQADGALEQSSWNRDVFRLVAQMAEQISVDISKFPLPEVLQIRAN